MVAGRGAAAGGATAAAAGGAAGLWTGRWTGLWTGRWTGRWHSIFRLDVDEDADDGRWLVGFCVEEEVLLDAILFEFGGVVDNCSWTNIMWSPSLIANVKGALPARKSFTWNNNKNPIKHYALNAK